MACTGQIHGSAALRLPQDEDAGSQGHHHHCRLAESLIIVEEKCLLDQAVAMASEQPAIGQALDSFRARQTEDVMAHDDPRQ